MDGDKSMADAADQPSAASAPPVPRPCYLEPATPIDAMFDQLEYLVAHASAQCTSECLECARLEQVKNWLLAPFRPACEDRTRPEPAPHPKP